MSDASPYAGLPEPLAPPWLDLSNHDWFPLYFDRLRKSKWWRRASDLARARNIMLWGEAYKAVPAGSLLDDDDELAEASGYGMDADAFLLAKSEILAAWTLCSDGRWYHPTVIEMATEAWSRMTEKRQKERIRKAELRSKKAQKPHVPGEKPDVPSKTGDVPRDTANVPRDTPQKEVGHPTQTDRQTNKIEGSNEPVASAEPIATAKGSPRKPDPWETDELFVMLWNACTAVMRRRAKSRANVWPVYLWAKKIADPQVILQGLGVYLTMDPDVKRTGGPGLHKWLRERSWEIWTPIHDELLGAAWSEGQWAVMVDEWRDRRRWDARLGPEPGEPGCRVPPQLLIAATKGAAA